MDSSVLVRLGSSWGQLGHLPFVVCPDTGVESLRNAVRHGLRPARCIVQRCDAWAEPDEGLPIVWTESIPTLNEAAGLADQQGWILQIYDTWLVGLAKRRGLDKLSASIYLENTKKSEAWQALMENRQPVWSRGIKFPHGGSPRSPDETSPSSIYLWRHIPYDRFRTNLGASRPLYYEEASYTHPFFSQLVSLDPLSTRFLADYMLRQLVESALVRIAIADDRIASYFAQQPRDKATSVLREYAAMGIWFVNKVTAGGGRDVRCRLAGPAAPDGLVSLDFGEDGSIRIPKGETPDDGRCEMLFIHQTVLEDKVWGPMGLNASEAVLPEERESVEKLRADWLRNATRDVPYLIAHSGRGPKPGNQVAGVGFLEFSTLQSSLRASERSKQQLCELGFSANAKEQHK